MADSKYDTDFESLPIPEKSYESLKADEYTDKTDRDMTINLSVRVRATNFSFIIKGGMMTDKICQNLKLIPDEQEIVFAP